MWKVAKQPAIGEANCFKTSSTSSFLLKQTFNLSLQLWRKQSPKQRRGNKALIFKETKRVDGRYIQAEISLCPFTPFKCSINIVS